MRCGRSSTARAQQNLIRGRFHLLQRLKHCATTAHLGKISGPAELYEDRDCGRQTGRSDKELDLVPACPRARLAGRGACSPGPAAEHAL